MRCKHCGYKNRPGTRFCGSCGKPLTADAEPTYNSSEITCSRCGYKNRIGTKYCASCGAYLSKDIKTKHRLPLAVVIAGALVLVAMIGAALFGVLGSNANVSNNGKTAAPNTTLVSLEDTGQVVRSEEEARAVIASSIKEVDQSQIGTCSTNTYEGSTYYRFGQQINGVTVYGSSLTLEADGKGSCQAITGSYATAGDISTNVNYSSEEARSVVIKALAEPNDVAYEGQTYYGDSSSKGLELCYQFYVQDGMTSVRTFVSCATNEVVDTIQMSFYSSAEGSGTTLAGKNVKFQTESTDDGSFVLRDTTRNISVYDARGKLFRFFGALKDKQGRYYRILPDESGNEVRALQDVASGKEITEFDEDEYEYAGLYLSVFGIFARIDTCKNNKTVWDDKKAVSVIHGVSNAYDYFKNKLHHPAFQDSKEPVIQAVINANQPNTKKDPDNVLEFLGTKLLYTDYKNAQGLGYKSADSLHSDILVSFASGSNLDVDLVAHEFTHGVENLISGMSYEGESGALMEATSDIFGELSQDYEDDGDMNGRCDWKNCHRDFVDSGNSAAVENSTTGSSAHPTMYRGANWGSTDPESFDHGYVHNNSTVISHAAYLMCRGSLSGEALSTEELGSLLFSSLYLLDSDCDFATYAGVVCWKATKTLSEQKARRVREAFGAVGITPQEFDVVEMDDVFDSNGGMVSSTTEQQLQTIERKGANYEQGDDDSVGDLPTMGALNSEMVGDGTYVYFTETDIDARSGAATCRISRILPDGSGYQSIYEAPKDSYLSNLRIGDGRLAVSEGNRILTMDCAGGGATEVAGLSVGYVKNSCFALWGDKLYYAAFSSPGLWEIRAVGLRGENDALVCSGSCAQGSVGPNVAGIADGHVLFYVGTPAGGVQYTQTLWSAPVAGGTPVSVSDVAYGRVAVVEGRAYYMDGDDLMSVGPDGSDRRRVCAIAGTGSGVLYNLTGEYAYIGRDVNMWRVSLSDGALTPLGERHFDSGTMNIVGDQVFFHYGNGGSIKKVSETLANEETFWRR